MSLNVGSVSQHIIGDNDVLIEGALIEGAWNLEINSDAIHRAPTSEACPSKIPNITV